LGRMFSKVAEDCGATHHPPEESRNFLRPHGVPSVRRRFFLLRAPELHNSLFLVVKNQKKHGDLNNKQSFPDCLSNKHFRLEFSRTNRINHHG
jgi:hypothetical protein